jgi:hypothetical protein
MLHAWQTSRLITGFVTRLTRRVPLVEQELPTLPEHLNSHPVFSGVRVARSLVLYVCFVNRCFTNPVISRDVCHACSMRSLVFKAFWSSLSQFYVRVDDIWSFGFFSSFNLIFHLCCFFWPLCVEHQAIDHQAIEH